MSTDTQIVEAIGEGLVIAQFLREGYEVARPIRDRGIDLVVYRDREGERFEAHPIQLKVSSKSSFGIWRKYEKVPGIWFVFAWEIGSSSPTYYRLTYQQAIGVATTMGWTETDSWTKRGAYVNNQPGEKLRDLLAPFEWTTASDLEPASAS